MKQSTIYSSSILAIARDVAGSQLSTGAVQGPVIDWCWHSNDTR